MVVGAVVGGGHAALVDRGVGGRLVAGVGALVAHPRLDFACGDFTNGEPLVHGERRSDADGLPLCHARWDLA